MAKLVLISLEAGEETTLNDLRRITGVKDFSPKTPQEIVSILLTTCYTGTVNSSDDTRSRAIALAKELGSFHYDTSIDAAVTAYMSMIKETMNFTPQYTVEGGSHAENLALQNLQARNRMVAQYTYAQLATTARKLPRAGSALLVLTSGNVVSTGSGADFSGALATGKVFVQLVHANHTFKDENLRGYYTKYDAFVAFL